MFTIGQTGTASLIVTPEKTAQAVGSGLLPVFGTPYLVALMEEAAVNCLQAQLSPEQGSVGTGIAVEHSSPTPIGMSVTATAVITAVAENGRWVEFAVSAEDACGAIGKGTHRRAIIHNEKFLAKCNQKAKQ